MEGSEIIISLIKTRILEGEIYNFIKVWTSVVISLLYSYYAGKFVAKGTTCRLITLLPVISLFLYLPLPLHSVNLGGVTAFFVAWLSNFKLLMFAFNVGPLSDPSLPPSHFIALACLPIRIQSSTTNPSAVPDAEITQNPPQILQHKQNSCPQTHKKGLNSPVNYGLKVILLALFIKIYDYKDFIHPNIIWLIYFFHVYFLLEIILAITAAMARAMFGFELEPQFDDPYLATSLQDFWGKRWNLMVTRILNPTIYKPTIALSAGVLGGKWAQLTAVFFTFVVSGMMHELIFYYMGRLRPTWEVTCFFLLHGACLVAEIAIKKRVNGSKWRLPREVTGPLTVVFVLTTAYWLFMPPLLRFKAEAKSVQEFAEVGAFIREVSQALGLTFPLRL